MQGSTVDQNQAVVSSAAEHSEHPDLRLFGFVIFLVSESMLFVGLFVAYLTFKAMNPEWPPEGTPRLELLLPGINTVILLSSSFVAHKADEAIKHEGDVAGVRKWFGITMAMGIVFLCGQLYEYSNLEFGLTTNVFASTFYVLTGFHGLHVLVGVLLMGGVLWRSRKPGH
ncbi:MAG: heme-copper oxidase subunit III, partial [Cyanobacteria bacterium P01_A01_bin.17]